MEYFIGSVVTLILVSVLTILVKRIPNQIQDFHIRNSQSYFYVMLGRHLDVMDKQKQTTPTQAIKLYQKSLTRILIVSGKAYWIKDNKVFVTNLINGEVDEANAKEVDIMSMDQIQLKEILFIVDKLKEDSYNDNWNAG